MGIKLLHQAKLSWGEVLPTELKDQWWELLEMLVDAGNVEFHRSTKPEDAAG